MKICKKKIKGDKIYLYILYMKKWLALNMYILQEGCYGFQVDK